MENNKERRYVFGVQEKESKERRYVSGVQEKESVSTYEGHEEE